VAAQVALPELAVSRAARHRAQQVRVDLNHLLHRLAGCAGVSGDGAARARGRTDVRPHTCARVHGHDDAVLEQERERRRAVARLHEVDHLALEGVQLASGSG